MSTVEAAASLFGSDDPSSDPFAALGDSDTPITSHSKTLGYNTYTSENNACDGASNFEGQQRIPDIQGGFVAPASHWSGTQALDQPAYDNPYTHAASSISSRYEEPGSWGENKQHGYENFDPQTGHAVVQNYTSTPNSYDSYAPQMSNASSLYDEPKRAAQTPAYTPYKPVAQSYAKPYNPPLGPASLPPQPKYDPYNSSTSPYQIPPVSQTMTSQPYPIPYSSKATVTATIPAPPAPVAATLNRPKRVDAYDPPFPSSRPSKRVVGRSTLHLQASTVAPSVYGAYGTVQNPPVPQGIPPVSSMSHAADYVGGSSGQDARGASSLPDGRNPPHDNLPYNDLQSTIAAKHVGFHPGAGYSPPHLAAHQTPQPWHAAQTSNDSRPVKQVSPPHQFPHETVSLMHTNFSQFRDASRTGSLADDGTVINAGHDHPFGSSSPPSATSYFDAGPYDTSSQYHITPQPIPQRVISPGALPQTQKQTQPENFEFYSTHEKDIHDPSISRHENDPGRKPLQDYMSLNSRNGSGESRHYSLSPEPIDDDPEASFGGQSVQSQDERGAMSSDDGLVSSEGLNNAVHDIYTPDPRMGGVGANSLSTDDSLRTAQTAVHNPYSPKGPNGDVLPQMPAFSIGKVALPQTQPSYLSNGSQITRSYSPVKVNSIEFGERRDRSNSTVYPTMPTDNGDPYAPSQHRGHVSGEPSHPKKDSVRHGYPMGPAKPLPYDQSLGQELLIGSLTQTPYAPSPSLLGLNDPLGRTAARVPVFSFGFGGKLVTCFHGSSVLNTGFDVALSSRRSMDVNIRILSKIIPESALDMSSVTFPGPLFADPGTPSTSLVRLSAAAQAKTKKARVSQYLHDRIEELARGIGYLQQGTEEKRKLEGKLVLAKLLKVMVENDGRLSGSPQVETAVRAALVPRLALSSTTGPQDFKTMPGLGLPPPADVHTSTSDIASFSYAGRLSQSISHETPISVSTLRPSALDKIQEFLLHGEREKACHFAVDEKLWAHAMLIASSIDKDMWKAVVSEFLKCELGKRDDASSGSLLNGGEPASRLVNGRESLRVAYSMFSGQGPACVQELLPQFSPSRGMGSLQVTALPHTTPITANFLALPPQVSNVPLESLSKWAETVAMMLSSNMTIESSSALTALGDCLAHHHWMEPAHVCYLLAPQTSPIGGLGQPTTRIILLGSPSPISWPNFHKDPDPIVFSEIVEFALSMSAPAKGQEAFSGWPHLQAFKLIRAMSLAEIGQIQLANRYCEAITASLGRGSPYFTTTFMEQLRTLSERIIAAPHIDKSMSWIGGKMSKPSLDGIGTWLEGRFTKLITGEGDGSPGVMDPNAIAEGRTFSGPFSHYSTISSATTSTSPSPQPSAINLNTLPQRSGSAMAYPLVTNMHTQIDRASSAIDYTRKKHSPAPRIASASATTTSFAQTTVYSNHSPNSYSLNDPSPALDMLTPKQSVDARESAQDVTWWGSSYVSDSSARTPTATSYLRVDESRASSSSSGFISLMDDASTSVTPTVSHAQEPSYDDEEDLGFGNPKKRAKPLQDNEVKETKGTPTDKMETAKGTAPEQSKANVSGSASWFSRLGLWSRRDASSPGPIKANLGEEKTFYYDEKLKRWVNKKSDAEGSSTPAAAPPPPSRSQTASPGRSGATLSPTTGGPPVRPATAIDHTSPPTRSVARVRSNLVPKEPVPPLPATPTSASSNGPPAPPSRPKSQATKRNVRSRYVDVFQQENAT